MAEQAQASALAQGLQGCSVCTAVVSLDAKECKGCGARLHGDFSRSIQETWAWLITSVVLYVPANFLPIMHTTFLGRDTQNTIFGGVVTLFTPVLAALGAMEGASAADTTPPPQSEVQFRGPADP